jgi:hypothetical protein
MNEEKQNNKKVSNRDVLKWIIIGLVAFVVVVLIFSVGMFIGGMKARFSYRWAEQYHKMFAGPRRGFFSDWQKFPSGEFIGAHGVFGEIIVMKENEFVIKGRDDVEKVILISEKTTIQKGREKLKKEDLKVGNFVVVIGSPNEGGQIEAKFIRVFPSRTSFRGICPIKCGKEGFFSIERFIKRG